MAMSPATQISESTRGKILAAIGSMTSLYKAGSSPDASLSKVAVDFGLLPDQLRIVGRGFNSGQTLTEVGEGTTLAEKTAGVRPLADIEGVIREVYSIDKKVIPTKAASTVASIYLQDPALSAMGKAAAFVDAPVHAAPAEVSQTRPPMWVAPNLYSPVEKRAAICQLRDSIHEADRLASETATQSKMAFSSLFDTVKANVDSADKVANLYFDAKRFHGEQGVELLKKATALLERGRAGETLRKAAEYSGNTRRVIPSLPSHPVMVKLGKVCQANNKAEQASKNQINRRMYASKVQRLIEGKEKVACLIGPDMGSYGKQVETYLQKFALNVAGVLGGLAAGRASGGVDPNSAKFREAELAMEDPEHDQSLQKIRLRATLQNLMDYDPIIQSYDPNEVLTAFNELSQSAPASIDNPVMLTANLRRLLQGDVAPFEAVQMQSADAEQRKLIEPMQAQLNIK